MTEVTLKTIGQKNEVTLKGHASGSEVVCAAISCLVYALAGYLTNQCKLIDTYVLDDGDVCLKWYGNREAYNFFMIGICQLEEGYPEYVRVLGEKHF